MRSKVIEEYKSGLYLNKRQKEILIGLILGDGHLEKLYTPERSEGEEETNSLRPPTLGRLKVEHSYKQKDYVDWIYSKFSNWVRSKPKLRIVKAWGKLRTNYGFSTYGHQILGKFQERFYERKKKIVPNDLEKDITPLGLAIWYMDDGSIKSRKHKGLFLNTQGFREDDVKRLQEVLKVKFGISSTTRKEKNGKQIYLGGKSGEKFIALIKPHIIFSMKYKIPRVLRLTELPKR